MQKKKGPEKVTQVFQVGGYSNEAIAKQEAGDFSRPEVFRNRSAFFPNPINHKITVNTVKVEVKSWAKSPNPFNRYYIEVTLEITGDKRRIETWCRQVQQALRINVPVNMPAGERAKHLQETGKRIPGRVPLGPAVPTIGGLPGERAAHLAERGIKPAKKEGAKQ